MAFFRLFFVEIGAFARPHEPADICISYLRADISLLVFFKGFFSVCFSFILLVLSFCSDSFDSFSQSKSIIRGTGRNHDESARPISSQRSTFNVFVNIHFETTFPRRCFVCLFIFYLTENISVRFTMFYLRHQCLFPSQIQLELQFDWFSSSIFAFHLFTSLPINNRKINDISIDRCQ